MAKLIKAEWYRLRHSGIFVFLLFALSFLMVIFPVVNGSEYFTESIAYNIPEFIGISQTAVPMFIGTIISAALGMIFSNRTGYYEVMDGNKTSHIILRKVAVYSITSLAAYCIPAGIYFAYTGIANGTGGYKNLPMFALLFVIIFLHIITSSVLVVLITKSLAGAVFPYARFFIIEMMFFEVTGATIKGIDKAAVWFPTQQLTFLKRESYDSDFIIKVFLSFLIEFIILYLFAYITYKKKNFRK